MAVHKAYVSWVKFRGHAAEMGGLPCIHKEYKQLQGKEETNACNIKSPVVIGTTPSKLQFKPLQTLQKRYG